MKYRNYIILAVVLVAVYFLFLYPKQEVTDVIDVPPVDPDKVSDDEFDTTDTIPVLRRRVSSPGIGRRPPTDRTPYRFWGWGQGLNGCINLAGWANLFNAGNTAAGEAACVDHYL